MLVLALVLALVEQREMIAAACVVRKDQVGHDDLDESLVLAMEQLQYWENSCFG